MRQLPREDRRRHVFEGALPHLFAESRKHLLANVGCGFRGDIANSWTGTTGSDDQAAGSIIRKAFQLVFDLLLLIRHDGVFDIERRD